MIPSIEQVMNRRHLVLLWLRALEIVLFVIGVMPVTFWAVESLFEMSVWSLSRFDEYLAIAMMFWLPGVITLLLDRRLMKWIVPLPKLACPECGQSLTHLAEPRCPECGCPLPTSLVAGSNPPA
jgi:hypothetical protein